MKLKNNILYDIPKLSIVNYKIQPNEIPSFIFHKVNPDDFEQLMIFLSDNFYEGAESK